ncbi:MAG: alkylation response protein AidB-like acyl-CoA dehydrogenase [Gammaproteobacteria bacterium]|jgi:alkylation response protein AidB-like acyl-CoA dehydrogenase
MTLVSTQEDRTFQLEVRQFIADYFPKAMKRKVDLGHELSWDEAVEWQRILARKGWLAPGWDKDYGGTGWSVKTRYIFEEELALAGCPPVLSTNIRMIGPVLIAQGSEAQKAKYLPRILSAEDWWCQGYSEPGAGSDLASLRTTAVRDGDEYVINGSKIWTSFAQHCNKMFCLVRTATGGKPQEGISFVLIDDLQSPGLQFRPIHIINGRHHFNQVFFDDVRVPVANRVGAENDGWTVAKSLLAHERLGGSRAPETKRVLARLRSLAGQEQSGGGSLLEEDWFQRRLWSAEIDHAALQQTIVRFVEAAAQGNSLGAETSMLKARGNRLHQLAHDLLVDAVGYYGLPFDQDIQQLTPEDGFLGPDYAQSLAAGRYFARGVSVAGGTQEIQSVVIAKQVLGL